MGKGLRRSGRDPSTRLLLQVAGLVAVGVISAGVYLGWKVAPTGGRIQQLRQYWSDPQAHIAWSVRAGERCGEAPLVMPTDGLVGFVWGDSFRPGHTHQGLDIFGPSGPNGLGQTPVVAASDGYLTRLPEWRSSVIQRLPSDPLQPGRTIWLYYTHMADADGRSYIHERFPPGTQEVFVPAGTLLGYQGNYSADPNNPVGMHLHFSIVLDDGFGRFRNELEVANTLDPSPYLGIEVNAARVGKLPPTCPVPAD